MAISLPKYQQQVSPSAEAQTVAQGGDAGSSADALASFAGTAGKVVGALGQQYIEKKKALKESADKADYEVRKRNFRQSLSDMETRALTEDGLRQDELEEKVYRPALEAFQAETQNQGYSPNMIGEINADWGNEVAKIGVEFASKQNKREIEDYVYRITSEAENLMADPETHAEGVAKLNELSGVIGEGRTKQAISSANYKINNVEIARLSEAFNTGKLEPKDYVDDMKALREKIVDSDMEIEHKKTLEANITYSIASASSKQAKTAQKMETALSKDVIEGDVTPEWKETAIAVYGEEATENIERILFNSLKKVGATNLDVRKGLTMISDMKEDPTSYTDVVKYAADNSGEYGEELRELAAIVAAEHINDGAAIAYSKYIPPSTFGAFAAGEIKTYSAPYTGWVADVHDDIIKAAQTTDDMSIIQGYQRKLIDFYYRNQKPTSEELTEFKSDLLGKHWEDDVQKLNAPQIPSETETIDTKAIWDSI
jgi:hypothetical protein